jgi:biopolymer transport protein ExbD/biopolymer transport protein TolR
MPEVKNVKAPPVVSEINVTPMVDVMLVLLIIFMVITPLLTKGQTVDRYRSKNAIAMQNADKEDAILVSIVRNGETFLSPGNRRVKMEDIAPRVQDLLTNRLDKTVYLISDTRAKYQVVEDVVDNLRAAGVDQLGLLTEQRNQEISLARSPAP